RRVAVDDDVVGRPGRAVRGEHEHIQGGPRPAVVVEGGLEGRTAHERRLAALEELAVAMTLACDEGRIGGQRRPAAGCRDVAVGAHAHAGADLHGRQSFLSRCPLVRSEPIATSRHGSMPSLLGHPDYTRERVRQVTRRAAALVHADTRAPDRMRIAGPVDRIAASDAAALDYRDAEPGMALGPLWATWWLEVEGRVPAEWEGEQVDL